MNSPFLSQLPLFVMLFVLVVGLAAMAFKRNMIKILMGVSLVESAVNLFLVSLGYRHGGIAPIFTMAPPENAKMALPTVQALTLTSIVIAVASTAMLLSFAMIIYRHYGTTNVNKIRKLQG